jgi:catechol 2,3-dioxygenase-like lactoylglutathione lyase family enzyme
MIKRWLHANLVVRDLDASVRFYEDLGFRKVREKYVEDPRVWAKLGVEPGVMRYAILQLPAPTPDGAYPSSDTASDFASPVLDICEFVDPPPEGVPYPSLNHLGIGRLSFEVDDIDDAHDLLERKGIEFLGPIAPVQLSEGTMYLFCFRDPDGIVVELGGHRRRA